MSEIYSAAVDFVAREGDGLQRLSYTKEGGILSFPT